MSVGDQLRFWAIAAALLGLILWALSDTLFPFVAGMAIAYLLDPMVERLNATRAPRWVCVGAVMAGFALAVVGVMLLILPALIAQTTALVSTMPEKLDRFENEIVPQITGWFATLPADQKEQLRNALGSVAGDVANTVRTVAGSVLSGGLAAAGFIATLVITPVVAFYLMLDWQRITNGIKGLIPKHHADTILGLLSEIDETLSGFVRGQAMVCIVLGTIYAVGLSLVGLHYGLLVGFVAGLLSFIPFVGSLIGFVVSMGIAFFQFDSWWPILAVAAIFIGGQLFEGNFLTPKLVGDRVGLHPVAVILAVMAGSALFAFTGALLAVPVAAVIGVLVRFAIKRYRASHYYTGKTPDMTAEPPVEHDSVTGAPVSRGGVVDDGKS